MEKERISNSAKKRVITLLEHYISRASGKKGTLTLEQEQEILDSFVTNEEKYTLNYYNVINDQIRYAFTHFGQLKYICFELIAQLSKYLTLWETYKGTQIILNQILSQIEDDKQRKIIIETFQKEEETFVAEIQHKDYKRINFNTKNDDFTTYKNNLEGYIQFYVMEINERLEELKATGASIKDHITSSGLNVKEYLKIIEQEEEAIISQRDTIKIVEHHPEILFSLKNYDEIKINQKEYNQFKEAFLTVKKYS